MENATLFDQMLNECQEDESEFISAYFSNILIICDLLE
jgi:hypothetical protein